MANTDQLVEWKESITEGLNAPSLTCGCNTTGIDWTSIHLSPDPLFTDEELDFVRAFNSRSG